MTFFQSPKHFGTQNILEGTDIISGQLPGDKQCPFSSVTISCRVWRKVLERDTQSVGIKVFFFFKYRFCPEDNVSIPNLVSMVTGQKQGLVEIKSAPSVAQPILAEFGERCQKVTLRVWGLTKYSKKGIRFVLRTMFPSHPQPCLYGDRPEAGGVV